MKHLIFIILIISFTRLSMAEYERADRSAEVNSEKEKEIRVRAKNKLYPGGKDESDIKVQQQLARPQKKMIQEFEKDTPEKETTEEE